MNSFFFYLFSLPSARTWQLFLKTLFLIGFKLFLLWSLLNLIERLQISSPQYAFSQILREVTNTPDSHLEEARALAHFAAQRTQIHALGYVRITKADELYHIGASARFNPFLMRIALQANWSQLDPYTQRWTMLHELGHVAALLSLRLTPLPLETPSVLPETQKVLSSSLTYQQAYAESFAEIFALALMLQLDPQDPKVQYEMALAKNATLQSVDLAHDTAPAILMGSANLSSLQTLQGVALLNLIDTLSTKAALLQVAQWGAEADAYCSSGAFSLPAWIASRGHMTYSNPWSIAKTNAQMQQRGMPSSVQELRSLFPHLHAQRLEQLAHHQKTYLLGKSQHFLPADIQTLAQQLQSKEEQRSFDEKKWALTLAALENATQTPLRRALFSFSYQVATLIAPEQGSFCTPWKNAYTHNQH